MPVFSDASDVFNRSKKPLDIKSCGPDASGAGAKLAGSVPPTTVARKPFTGESTK
jgi:hypothetical protein